MLKLGMRLTAIMILGLSLLSSTAIGEPRDPKQAVQEIAGLHADTVHIATVLRISEGIAFWQSVAIMGAQNDWDFTYSGGGG